MVKASYDGEFPWSWRKPAFWLFGFESTSCQLEEEDEEDQQTKKSLEYKFHV